MKKTAIITLCYNKLKEATEPYLNSLYEFTNKDDFDLYLVDNGSSDGTSDFIKEFQKKYDNIKLIQNPENLGYSKGNNIGLKEVLKGDYQYIGLLNNDVLFTPDWLNNTLKIFDLNPALGMVSPRIQKKCNLTPKNYLKGYKKYLSGFKGEYKIVLESLFCCAVIKKEVFEKVGLLDEAFTPAFFEDDDFCFRVMYHGFSNAYSNSAFVYHNHRTTSKSVPSEIYNRNKQYFYKKHPLGKYIFEHRRSSIIKDFVKYIKESFDR